MFWGIAESLLFCAIKSINIGSPVDDNYNDSQLLNKAKKVKKSPLIKTYLVYTLLITEMQFGNLFIEFYE